MTKDSLVLKQKPSAAQTALPNLDQALREVASPGSYALESPSFERKPTDPRDVNSPHQSVRSTFLGGSGIFDWAISPLMTDIKKG